MRDTKEIETPQGHKAVVYTYLTGREAQTLRTALAAEMKVDMSDAAAGRATVSDVPAAVMFEQEKRALSFLLVSFDGVDGEKGLEALLDLPATEYDFVKAEIDKITNPTPPTK